MSKFLVLYNSNQTAREQMAAATPEQAQAGMDAWMAWANKAGSAIVDLGSPLGDSTTVGGKGAAGPSAGGYSIMQADSVDKLKGALDGHPHLMVPGNTIQVMEFLPIQGM
jgi:hypothetical protein